MKRALISIGAALALAAAALPTSAGAQTKGGGVAAEGAGLPRAAEAEGAAELRGVVVVVAAESPAVHHPWVAAVPR